MSELMLNNENFKTLKKITQKNKLSQLGSTH
jgi:hypothetical protein